MAAIGGRLRSLERSIKLRDPGSAVLILKPEVRWMADEPRVEITGPRGDILLIRYPEKAVGPEGRLIVGVESLIPDGPDRERFATMLRSARRRILVRYVEKWRG